MTNKMQPVDHSKWMKDEIYTLETAKSIQAELATIPNYRDKVNYLKSLSLDPASSYLVYENDFELGFPRYGVRSETAKLIFAISLKMEAKTDEQKSELARALFDLSRAEAFAYAKENPTSMVGFVIPYADLVADYKKRLKMSPLPGAFIEEEKASVNALIDGLKPVFKEAAKRVRNEFLKVKPLIDWTSFDYASSSRDSWLRFVWDLIEYQIFIEGQSTRKPYSNLIGSAKAVDLKSTLTNEQACKLFSGLLQKGFIAPDTDESSFLAVFEGGSKAIFLSSINWIAEEQKLLVYLLYKLTDGASRVLLESRWQNKIEKHKIFTHNNSNIITANSISVQLSTMKSTKSFPNGHSEIDLIVNEVVALRKNS